MRPQRIERSRGLPQLPARRRSSPLISKWEETKSDESTGRTKVDKRLALRQATTDATKAEAFVTQDPQGQKTAEAWNHMQKLRRHEARLEKLLKRVFEFKQETLQDQRTRERIGDVLSALEQVERAENALRETFFTEEFPPELRILEGEEEQEKTDKLMKIRAAINPDDFWQFLGDEEEQISGTRPRKQKNAPRKKRAL